MFGAHLALRRAAPKLAGVQRRLHLELFLFIDLRSQTDLYSQVLLSPWDTLLYGTVVFVDVIA